MLIGGVNVEAQLLGIEVCPIQDKTFCEALRPPTPPSYTLLRPATGLPHPATPRNTLRHPETGLGLSPGCQHVGLVRFEGLQDSGVAAMIQSV